MGYLVKRERASAHSGLTGKEVEMRVLGSGWGGGGGGGGAEG